MSEPTAASGVTELVADARRGDRRAVARLLTLVEIGGDGARAVSDALFASSGRATTIGITGAPGAGKSTLTNRLVGGLRARERSVGVLAIDPSSPFTGGAILGDRVRMQDHGTDPHVFIRSMATRGHLGGLATSTPQAARVLDALGMDVVLIETVGVGQVEVEIAGQADTTVVVVNPGWGDSVQAAKAGLMEIADVFVVNKADRAGAADTVRDLTGMLDLASRRGWRPPIVSTVATTGEGTDALLDALDGHRAHLDASGDLERRRAERLRGEIRALVADELARRADLVCAGDEYEALVAAVAARACDPFVAADRLLAGSAFAPHA